MVDIFDVCYDFSDFDQIIHLIPFLDCFQQQVFASAVFYVNQYITSFGLINKNVGILMEGVLTVKN